MDPNELTGPSFPLSAAELAAAEEKLGLALSADMRAFYLARNGGLPERHYFHTEETAHDFEALIPIEPGDGAEPATGMVHTYRRMTDEGLLPKTSIPFGRDPGGNFFLIDPADERVWYMPMDEWHEAESAEANWARSGRTLTHGFTAFMDALEEDDF